MSDLGNLPVHDSEGSFVEKLYVELMYRMGPEWRLNRAFSLHQSLIEAIRFQLSCEYPELSEKEIKIKAAERMYFSDPKALELLKQARQS